MEEIGNARIGSEKQTYGSNWEGIFGRNWEWNMNELFFYGNKN